MLSANFTYRYVRLMRVPSWRYVGMLAALWTGMSKNLTVKQIRAAVADGRTVNFHGYDDRDYPAVVIEYRRKIATLRYRVFMNPTVQTVRAYISDLNRIEAL